MWLLIPILFKMINREVDFLQSWVEKLSTLYYLIYLVMKKLFIFAFAIIALCSSCGNGCSRSVDSSDSARVDTTIVTDTLAKDSVNKLDSANVDSIVEFSMVCPD